jgi:hypothetical protein
VSRPDDNGVFTTGKTAFGGVAIGMGSAHVAGMLLANLIAPGLGALIGGGLVTTIAAAWCGFKSLETARIQKLEAHKRECFGALQQALASAHQSAMSQVNILISDMQAEASSLLQKMLQQANDKLLKSRGDLNQRQKATQQEVLQKQKAAAELDADLASIKKALENFQTVISA